MKINFQNLLDKLQKIPFFSDLDLGFLFDFVASTDLRIFERNELVCGEGEYENTCCIILSGSVGVWIKQKTGKKEQVAFLGSGEIFGEIAALSGRQRIASIISSEHSEILFMDKKALFMLMDRSKKMKDFTNKRYRERMLKTELKKIKFFDGFPDTFFEELIEKSDLVSFQMGENVISYGEEANDFYHIIFGFAKVLIPHSTEEGSQAVEKNQHQVQPGLRNNDLNFKIAAYLPAGHYFGEIGLIENRKRGSTVSALTRLELIKIDQKKFHSIISKHKNIRNMLENVVANRRRKNIELAKDKSYERLMDWTVSSNVIQANAVLIIDLNRCIKCETCINTCDKLFGKSRLSFDGLTFDNILIPTSCRHCQDPLCLEGCPTGAISRDFSGEVYHKDFCIGCGNCAKKCPFGNISIVDRKENHKPPFSFLNDLFLKTLAKDHQRGTSLEVLDRRERSSDESFKGDNRRVRLSQKVFGKESAKLKPSLKIATKCDNCKDFPYMGCVQNCPRGAAQRINPREYFKEIMPA